MARPLKRGLDYFSLDVDFFEDEKVKKIGCMYGIKGEAVVLKLLCRIYSNGFYIDWDREAAMLFFRNFFAANDGVSNGLIDGIVSRALEVGLFNAGLYKNFGILTARSIQNRYLQAVSRRKNIYLVKEFMLIDVDINEVKANIVYLPYNKQGQAGVNVDINKVNVDTNSINASDNTQSKVNNIHTYIQEINADINSVNVDNNVEVYKQAMDIWQSNIGKVPMGVVADDMQFYLSKIGLGAFKVACEYTNRGNPDNKQKYVLAVLKNWCDEGVDSAEKAEASIAERISRNKNRYGNQKIENDTTNIKFYEV